MIYPDLTVYQLNYPSISTFRPYAQTAFFVLREKGKEKDESEFTKCRVAEKPADVERESTRFI